MNEMPQRPPIFLVEDLETLRLLTDPLRLQIIEMLTPEPQTVNQVAGKLGLSNSRLYYHFNLLEKHGLIEVVETHMVNNMLEKLYWLVAEDIEIDKALLDFSSGEVQENLTSIISSSLEATRSEMLRSLQARTFNLEHGAKPVPRNIIIQSTRKRLKDETYEEFMERLRVILKEFSELPEETGAGEDISYFSLACFLYPNFYYEEDQEMTKGTETHD